MINVSMDFFTNVLIYGASFALLYICTWRHNQFDAFRGITRKQFYYRLGYIIVVEAISINILFLQGNQDSTHVLSDFFRGNGGDLRHAFDYALEFLILSSWAQRYSLCFKEKGWVVPLLLLWSFFDLTAEYILPSAAAFKLIVFAIVSLGAIILPKEPEPEEEKTEVSKGQHSSKGKNKKKNRQPKKHFHDQEDEHS